MSETKKSFVCIDANLVIWHLLPFPMSDRVDALMRMWHDREVELQAPTLLAFEVASTLRRLVYLKEISVEGGEAAFASFQRMNIRLSSRSSIIPLAWKLAIQYDRPRAYDAAYVALAQLESCDFWTADRRLYNSVSDHLPWVHWVGEAA